MDEYASRLRETITGVGLRRPTRRVSDDTVGVQSDDCQVVGGFERHAIFETDDCDGVAVLIEHLLARAELVRTLPG
jgi:hypothetical protein